MQGYSFKQIMSLAKAANLPSGKSYETVNDLCTDMVGRVVRVKLDHEKYNGEDRERVKFINESHFPECKHVYKDKPAVSSDTVAQKPVEQFAGQTAALGNLDDFEEILGDGEVPF